MNRRMQILLHVKHTKFEKVALIALQQYSIDHEMHFSNNIYSNYGLIHPGFNINNSLYSHSFF